MITNKEFKETITDIVNFMDVLLSSVSIRPTMEGILGLRIIKLREKIEAIPDAEPIIPDMWKPIGPNSALTGWDDPTKWDEERDREINEVSETNIHGEDEWATPK
jgi:hypothetical protein